MSRKEKLIVGWEEWLSMPDLHIPAIKAKVDTGAKTSALHAFAIEPYGKKNKRVRFSVHPLPERPDITIQCSAPLVDQREVTSSNGEREMRYVIQTTLQFDEHHHWPVEVTLTNRETMSYRMLIGREAMKYRFSVDPNASFLTNPLSEASYEDHVQEELKPRVLKIGILSRDAENYSVVRLKESAEQLGHTVQVINTARCYMNITANKPAVHLGSESLTDFDVIIPRIGTAMTSYGLAVIRQFESMGVFCLDPADAISRSRDKLYAQQLIARSGIDMPVTSFANSPNDTKELVNIVGSVPLVIKLLEGTQGRGVVLAETRKAAESVVDAFRGIKANILVQEYIKEAEGSDIQCFVVGNKVVGAMMRTSESGELPSDVYKGSKIKKVKLTKDERKIAVRAARVLGLRVATVNLVRSEQGPKVLEVNSSPNLEDVEKATGKDIAELIIEFIEGRLIPKPKTKKVKSEIEEPVTKKKALKA